ncbi:response regulator [Leptolyngbya boryana CZ1]|jgi:DNA-binding response OmpR family regulator|uniref:Crp/Fnr family transcriptional regulator n=3 Tax=Leptolyngbya TaxID=47251 RepID=A0A1Z4JA19_LEPBY|nr:MULTISPECIES: response regulator [Leptolyngbya]BAY53602.1 Crp/Fnr family transcriptional regulator [Leptolyngbya boryana NIES-2135]MBD1855774.1 response regulator [Leptolyngbya sp. FACHB-1624]MBD2371417.1 response regulator [Leptolyngbya sp. FACHB-161]MBD2377920.1 response regulator [Leptolyngbya sp. FACHB-238]MBD2402359.1 response regulator [Leptolyngbya sp. FACHB-239]
MMIQTILLIEDHAALRANLAEMLELEGYRVIEAEDGSSGIKLATEERPNLIVSDFELPIFDGFDVLRLLRQNLETMNIPILFLTGAVENNDRLKILKDRGEKYLSKPCSLSKVLAEIRECLS